MIADQMASRTVAITWVVPMPRETATVSTGDGGLGQRLFAQNCFVKPFSQHHNQSDPAKLTPTGVRGPTLWEKGLSPGSKNGTQSWRPLAAVEVVANSVQCALTDVTCSAWPCCRQKNALAHCACNKMVICQHVFNRLLVCPSGTSLGLLCARGGRRGSVCVCGLLRVGRITSSIDRAIQLSSVAQCRCVINHAWLARDVMLS